MKARINTAALSVDLIAGLTFALVNIPQAMAHALLAAGLVILAGVQMINVNAIQTIWQTNPVSRTIMPITFGSTLVMPLQYAVLLGVAISILLSVFQRSNTLRIVEWAIQESGWPVEQPALSQLESERVTALYVYGNLFYAAATTFEKGLPAVVILLLRGFEDIGSTLTEVLRRYTQALQANGGKLILAGVCLTLRGQLQRTGMFNLIGEENIFLATETIGEAGNAALRAAKDWLAETSIDEEKDGK
jgi:SulP family sulfate permease